MTRLLIGALVAFTMVGCAKPEQPAKPLAEASETKRIASVDVVKAEVQPVEISVGTAGETIVRLTIQSGYHVNANPPTYSYLIPTDLTITPAGKISAGKVSYPPPMNVKLSFSEKPLAVYEGTVEIRAMLNVGKSAKPGEQSLPAKLRIQACDDQVCYPPGTREMVIPVKVK